LSCCQDLVSTFFQAACLQATDLYILYSAR
jgi:hypothetical protein